MTNGEKPLTIKATRLGVWFSNYACNEKQKKYTYSNHNIIPVPLQPHVINGRSLTAIYMQPYYAYLLFQLSYQHK